MAFLRTCTAAALIALAMAAPPARAAGGEDNCTGFIDALPATISTQGVWCLRADLDYAGYDYAAVEIAASNVTLDCNGFGMTATIESPSAGVGSVGVMNATVRGCRFVAFYKGVQLAGGGGHLVEGNLVRNAPSVGISVSGEGNLVRRNRVLDTGGTHSQPKGIDAVADVVDNVVDGVWTSAEVGWPVGINVEGVGAVADGNVVRGVQGYLGLHMAHSGSVASRNHIVAGAAGGTVGIASSGVNYCLGNTVKGYDQATACDGESDNLHD